MPLNEDDFERYCIQQEKEYRIEHGVGCGATLGKDVGVAGWRHKNWWREPNPSDEIAKRLRRQRWEQDQAPHNIQPVQCRIRRPK